MIDPLAVWSAAIM